MTLLTNKDRAERARHALDAYTLRDVIAPDELAGLICDLLHLSMENGLDPRQVIRTAISSFVNESLSSPDSFNLSISTFIDW